MKRSKSTKGLIIRVFQKEKRPHTCPVCEGRGAVEAGFYNGPFGWESTSNAHCLRDETCKSCKGKGVLIY